jgi:hypothetical protein
MGSSKERQMRQHVKQQWWTPHMSVTPLCFLLYATSITSLYHFDYQELRSPRCQ